MMDSVDEIFNEELARQEMKNISEELDGFPFGAMLLIAIFAAIGGAVWARIMHILKQIKLKTVFVAIIIASIIQAAVEEAELYWVENDISGQIQAAIPEPTAAADAVTQTTPDLLMFVLTCMMVTLVAITIIRILVEER